MMDIKSYLIVLFIIAIIRWLLPKFKNVVNWLIIKSVKYAEKMIKGSKMGATRKKKVLSFLKICGIKTSDAVSELIDITVDIMNNKQDDVKSNIADDISNKFDDGINKITNK